MLGMSRVRIGDDRVKYIMLTSNDELSGDDGGLMVHGRTIPMVER